MELDHVFVLCASGAPEADALVTLGLTEGSSNAHKGQGTACRRFFFDRMYLELLWVANPEEARSDLARPTGLWDRWSGRHGDACPFGIVVAPSPGEDASAPPFDAWQYEPPFLPPDLPLYVADGVPLGEPACFWLGVHRAPTQVPSQPTDHALGTTVTDVSIGTPWSGAASPAVRAIEAAGLVTMVRAESYVLDLTLDGGTLGRSMDLRPVLPLRLRV